MIALMAKTDRNIREELLGAVGTEWVDRPYIAEKLGKKRLNPSEINHLNKLVSDGIFEAKTELVGITPKYFYRKA